MVRYVKADTDGDNFVNYSKIRTAVKQMKALLYTLDSMNEPTFGAFDQNCTEDVYTIVSDSIISLSNVVSDR